MDEDDDDVPCEAVLDMCIEELIWGTAGNIIGAVLCTIILIVGLR